MRLIRVLSLAAVLVSLLVTTGCAVQRGGITTATGVCCADPTFETFEVVAQDIPAFLGPLMVSNFSVALAERGLAPVDSGGDVVVTLRYEQQDLSDPVDVDSFDERIESGGDVRFIAKMVVEMRAAGSDEIAWSGTIQRVHNIGPGEYMHTGRASLALLESFMALLESYPGPAS